MKRQFSTALALSLAAAIQLGAADLYVASGALETASCASIAEACDFQRALNIAAYNTEANTIHVAAGDYDISTMLRYDPNPVANNNALAIQGAGATSTILKADGSWLIMSISTEDLPDDSDAHIVIKGITFKDCLHSVALLVSTESADVTIEDSTFSENNVEGPGGAGARVTTFGGNITLTNSIFSGNYVYDSIGGGAALSTRGDGNITLTNNIFSGNMADNGGGGATLYASGDGKISLVNNTISGNTAKVGNAGIRIRLFGDSAKAELYNNIIWGNETRWGEDAGEDLLVYNDGADSMVILKSNNLGPDANFTSGQSEDLYITDTDNYTQASNLKEDPLFVDADNGDFHLTESSPLIDTGDLNAPALPEKDFEGDKRVIDGNGDSIAMPDIGADEYNPPEKQAEDIIELIKSGNLESTGPGKSEDKRMDALANKIDVAKQLIEDEDIDGACDQLKSTLKLTDGDTTPPDWVEGDTAVELAAMIQKLMDSIGCP